MSIPVPLMNHRERRASDGFDCDLVTLIDRATTLANASNRRTARGRAWQEIERELGALRLKVLPLLHPDDRRTATGG